MGDINVLTEKIKQNILIAYQKAKTEIFESNGQTYGRSWKDLTPEYKKRKTKELGSPYPIQVYSEDLLHALLNDALVVEVNYNESEDNLDFKVFADISKIKLEYAEAANKGREFISFSDEEKKLITQVVADTVSEFYGGSS